MTKSQRARDATSSANSPVKDLLFEYIGASDEIPALLAEKRFEEIVRLVTKECYDRAAGMGDRQQSIGVLATGLLHYLLTRAMIPSQRKVEFRGVDVDIIVPDLRTLEKNPQKALLVCIQTEPGIKDRLASLEKIQPIRENIWAVQTDGAVTGYKSFIVSKDGEDFSGIISEMKKFADAKFGILGLD
ncbi:MAG: hypothetical protein EB830_04180 [Nitrosopumilus sp. H13]|nr:MAG: hypothetical protein EB830_04180 [Nitrosopumilus sp. H13]